MANDSLEHEACTRQSHSKNVGILDTKLPEEGVCDDILQAMTFSLTFTASQWRLFWRLLNVGCLLADEQLDEISAPTSTAKSDTAKLWNRLSAELAVHLKKGEVHGLDGKGASRTMR